MDVLHAISYGAREDAGGARLLERLLSAIPPDRALRPVLPLEAGEAAVVEDLLRTVILRWPAIGKTSPEGLR